jgi:hypothetical protein
MNEHIDFSIYRITCHDKTHYGGGGKVAGRGGATPAPIGGGGKLFIDGA